jgi:cytochrome P450
MGTSRDLPGPRGSRLLGVAPQLRRDQLGTYQVERAAKSIVLLSPWTAHRRADLWPEPERFDPARFEPAAEQARPRYAYFPFAGGLRGCIGGHFAMTEAVVAVATLLARFSVASESLEIPLLTNITLRPAGPVWCRLTLREPARLSR